MVIAGLAIGLVIKFFPRNLRSNEDALVGKYVPPGAQLPRESSRAYILNNNVPIIMYHYIEYNRDSKDTIRISLTITPYWFEKQILWLKEEGYTIIPLEDLVMAKNGQKQIPAKSIVLTFDDGYEDFYTDAWPVLKKYQVPATIYVISKFLDRPNYLRTWQLVQMATDSGRLISVGAHTRHHINLKQSSSSAILSEIADSKRDLEEIINQPVIHFAYPYGAYDSQAEEMVISAGFLSAATTQFGQVGAKTDMFALPRIRVGNYASEELRARLAIRK